MQVAKRRNAAGTIIVLASSPACWRYSFRRSSTLVRRLVAARAKNNLHQIAIAVNDLWSARKKCRLHRTNHVGGWEIAILPYLDEKLLWDNIQ